MAGDPRTAPRHWVDEPLRVERVPSPSASSHLIGFAANVSETGIFVQCPLPPPEGTHMTLQLRVAGDANVVARSARVIWVRDRVSAPLEPAGVGVELGSMDEASRELWRAFCRRQARGLNSDATRA